MYAYTNEIIDDTCTVLQVYRYIILSWPEKLIRWYLFESKYNLILQFLNREYRYTRTRTHRRKMLTTSQRGLKLIERKKKMNNSFSKRRLIHPYLKKWCAQGTVCDDLSSQCGDGGGGRGRGLYCMRPIVFKADDSCLLYIVGRHRTDTETETENWLSIDRTNHIRRLSDDHSVHANQFLFLIFKMRNNQVGRRRVSNRMNRTIFFSFSRIEYRFERSLNKFQTDQEGTSFEM